MLIAYCVYVAIKEYPAAEPEKKSKKAGWSKPPNAKKQYRARVYDTDGD